MGIQHGTPDITIPDTCMERKSEVLTQNLHQILIQREDLRPMPKPIMPIMATIQHGTLDITIPDTCMERKSEVLTQSLHQNQIQREDLKPMPKPGMHIMDTTQHGTPPHMPIHTTGPITMERRREVLTQNLHRNLIQREDLKPMLKPGMLIMDTTQHGIPDITTTHTTIMESNKS